MQAAFRATFKAVTAIPDLFVAAPQHAGGPLGDIRLVRTGRWGAEAPPSAHRLRLTRRSATVLHAEAVLTCSCSYPMEQASPVPCCAGVMLMLSWPQSMAGRGCCLALPPLQVCSAVAAMV